MTVFPTQILIYVYFLTQAVISQDCLQTGNGNGLPDLIDYRGNGIENNRIVLRHQAIIPSYKFDCNQMCGNITEWGVDVHPGGRGHQNVYTLDLQVWRPSPTVDDSTGTGQYSLVGNNRFTSISLSDQLARVTPSPQDYIQFQPGDVLGFYVEEARRNNEGVVILISNDFTSEVVWLASIAPSQATSLTTYPVGSNGVLNTLTRAAPVISIATVTFSCPTPPVATTLPTPPPQTTTDNDTPPPTTQETVEPTISEPTTTDDIDITTTKPNVEIEIFNLGSSEPTSSERGVIPPTQAINNRADFRWIVPVVVIGTILFALAVVMIIAIVVVGCKKHSKNGQRYHLQHYDGQPIDNRIYGVQGDFGTKYKKIDPPSAANSSKPIRYARPENHQSIASVNTFTRRSNSYMDHDYHVLEHNTPKVSGPPVKPKLARPHVQAKEERQLGDEMYHNLELDSTDYKPGNVYEAPTVKSSPDGAQYSPECLKGTEVDVFDTAGYYVPTMEQRANCSGHYEMQETKGYKKLKFFEEDKIYWAPASTTSDLYYQLASKKYREIPRNQIKIINHLGCGEFGQVCKAVWSISGATKELAVKTLREELPEEEKVRFLQEAAIMGQFSHPNVVKLYGVVTVGDPVMICLECMTNGDLRGYLLSINTQNQSAKEMEVQFLHFSTQIASGMNYLASKSFVHRDLAARNVLLNEYLVCKVGDFGMARDLMNEIYYTASTKAARIPVKWTAPEALLYRKYSTDSDVWSYGMVLFEIWSVGKKPFSQITNSDFVNKLRLNTGYNQPPPPGCPNAIYQLMINCWHPEHSKRPTFSEICHYLSSSNSVLLKWVETQYMLPPKSRELGAPLSEAKFLYKDLQDAYTNKN